MNNGVCLVSQVDRPGQVAPVKQHKIRIAIIALSTILTLIVVNSDAQDKNRETTEPVRYWSLSTGSRIAYVHIPATDSSNATPLVFVHGGPGAYQVSEYLNGRGADWYRHLANAGFDVYLYDQIGSGLSARLTDPREYTVSRHTADLEAIRNVIGRNEFVLVGDSWGATLVANYMARYPKHTRKAVFTSPGALDLSELIDSTPSSPQIISSMMQWIESEYGPSAAHRYDKLNRLMQVDIHAAYTTAPDSEMDPLMDKFMRSLQLISVNDKSLVKGMQFHGAGWWVFTMTNWDAACNRTHPRLTLAKDHTPVLILRGDSDYLPESFAQQYESTFPNAKFVQVVDSGHFIWLDQPLVYARMIEMFLLSPKPTK